MARIIYTFYYFCSFRFRLKFDGKADRTLKELGVLNTTFGQISRHVIWGDERPRDLYSSTISCNVTQALLDAYFGWDQR